MRVRAASLAIAAHWGVHVGSFTPGALEVCARHLGCESLKGKRPAHCACVGSLCELPAGLPVGCMCSRNVQRWRFPFSSIPAPPSRLPSPQSSLWLPPEQPARGAECRGPLALRVLAILKASSEAIEPGWGWGGRQIYRCQIKQGEEVILATQPPPLLRAVNSGTALRRPAPRSRSIPGSLNEAD